MAGFVYLCHGKEYPSRVNRLFGRLVFKALTELDSMEISVQDHRMQRRVKQLLQALGQWPRARVSKALAGLLDQKDELYEENGTWLDLWSDFSEVVQDTLAVNPSAPRSPDHNTVPITAAWEELQYTFYQAFAACFADGHPQACIFSMVNVTRGLRQKDTRDMTVMPIPAKQKQWQIHPLMLVPVLDSVWPTLLEMVTNHSSPQGLSHDECLGKGSGSAVVYSSALENLELPETGEVRYLVVDGSFLINNRAYQSLCCDHGVDNSADYEPAMGQLWQGEPLCPSFSGRHDDLTLHAAEGDDVIAISSTIVKDSTISDLCLARALSNATKILHSNPCDHPRGEPVVFNHFRDINVYVGDILKTGLPVSSSKIGIMVTMTDEDRQAQLLAAGAKNFGIGLVRAGCCLSCALAQMRDILRKIGDDPLDTDGYDALVLC
jgi:hypothetical protein